MSRWSNPNCPVHFGTIMEWADDIRRMKVRTNADTPKEAKAAHSFGAEGIGLCRTEHMFFEDDRIRPVREMIIADTEEERREALAKLLPMQREDFIELVRNHGRNAGHDPPAGSALARISAP